MSKVVHCLSGPAHSYLQFKPRPPPSADEYSEWGDYWGQRAFFFFQATPIQDFLLQLQQLERIIWCSDAQKLHICTLERHNWRKIIFKGLFLYSHNRFHPFWSSLRNPELQISWKSCSSLWLLVWCCIRTTSRSSVAAYLCLLFWKEALENKSSYLPCISKNEFMATLYFNAH